MTWKNNPLSAFDKDMPSNVGADQGFSELETALKMGLMPHQWMQAPRWSRVLAVAVTNIRSKLDYISASERGAK